MVIIASRRTLHQALVEPQEPGFAVELLERLDPAVNWRQLGREERRGRPRFHPARQKAIRRYPMRKVTTPVPVEGSVAGGALPKSAGSSFHGRRKPNGSACQRRTMAGVQAAAKHAISAMSPLKSCPTVDGQPAASMRLMVLLEKTHQTRSGTSTTNGLPGPRTGVGTGKPTDVRVHDHRAVDRLVHYLPGIDLFLESSGSVEQKRQYGVEETGCALKPVIIPDSLRSPDSRHRPGA
jgi:hypothetical protein